MGESVAQFMRSVYAFWYFFDFWLHFATELQKLASFRVLQASPGQKAAHPGVKG